MSTCLTRVGTEDAVCGHGYEQHDEGGECMTPNCPCGRFSPVRMHQPARPIEGFVAVRVDANDFGQLSFTSMRWGGQGWPQEQADRFEQAIGNEPINWDLKFAYWMERWADVMLGRAFLEANGWKFQVLVDEADGTYVVTTDFAGTWVDDDDIENDGLVSYVGWPFVDGPTHEAGSLSFTLGRAFAGREKHFDMAWLHDAVRDEINRRLQPHGIVLRRDGKEFRGPEPRPENAETLIIDAYQATLARLTKIAETYRLFVTGADAMDLCWTMTLSVNDFAERVGVAPYVVRQWENHNIPLTDASIMALRAVHQKAVLGEGKGQ